MSAEARSAAGFRSGGGEYAAPPETLNIREQEIWNSIIRSKPADWFDAGSLLLLARYCVGMNQAEKLEEILRATPTEDAKRLETRVITLYGSLVTLATKLRLSVQAAVDRRSRILDEKGPGEQEDKNRLLGGKGFTGLRAVS